MLENLKKIYQEETFAERSKRMVPAAVYGALIGTAYVLTRSLINVYTIPNLPLGIDWAWLLGMWIMSSTRASRLLRSAHLMSPSGLQMATL